MVIGKKKLRFHMFEFEIIWTADRLCWTNNSQDTGGASGFDGHLSGTVIKPQNMLWIQKITQFTVYNLN